jgi:cytoskeletal protein CcmA (bactofilin family)
VNKRLYITLFVTLLIVGSGKIALAQGPSDQVVVNGQYTLGSGKTHEGDLTIAAQDVQLKAESHVTGDVSIVSASATLDGEIDGDVSILASDVQLGKNLRINGDLSVCARNFVKDSAARITGDQSTGCNSLGELFSGMKGGRGNSPIRMPIRGNTSTNPVAQFFGAIISACVVAALAALLAVIFPNQIQRMTTTAMSTPMTTGIAGFLSMGVAVAVTAIYAFSIVLTLGVMCIALPLVGLGWLAFSIALLAGWIAISVPVGKILLHRMKIYPTPMIAAALGALVLTFFQGFLGMVPCIGWISNIVALALASVGLGAVLLTRFGTRPYPEFVSARVRPEIL